MKKDITITSHDGGEFSAFVCFPDSDLPAPGIVVIHEMFGVDDTIRKVTEHVAQAGYFAVCPDLFWRQKPNVRLDSLDPAHRAEAVRLSEGFDLDLGLADLKTALAFVRSRPDCTGKAATVGFGLGGTLAFLMAVRTDADCNVSYYGTGIENFLDEAKNIKKPLLMHIAENDAGVPLAAQEKILSVLNRLRRAEVHVHPGADNGFARLRSVTYDKAAAQRANYVTADFLATHIAKRRT